MDRLRRIGRRVGAGRRDRRDGHRATGAVTQTIHQPAAFIGLTFSPDGKTLYASGGNDDVVHVYRWADGRAIADGKIVLRAKKDPTASGTSYPAGLALSPNGRFLY